jgi:hypothetical protein
MFHLYPTGDWMRHVTRLQRNANRFGRVIIGVATDAKSASLEQVNNTLPVDWEVVHAMNEADWKNKGLREVATYQQMMPTLTTGPNDVTFCAHGKGAQPHTETSDAVQWWADVMWRTIIENTDEVVDRIRSGAAIVGSFRRRGTMLGTRHRWHFSGTFYAFRNCVAFEHGVPVYKPIWFGTESWPGDYFPIKTSDCVFGDDSGDLYKIDQQPRSQFEQWKRQHGDVFTEG